jgi:actin-related protein 2
MGWSTEANPQVVYPSVVGRPKLIGEDSMASESIKDVMIGHEAWKARKFLDLKYPIENGVVKDWDDCVLLWKHGFDQMGVKPANTSVLVTEPVRNSDLAREKVAELIFEKFGFSSMQCQIQAILSMYSEGKRTACVLDSGDGVSNVIPIVDSFILNNQIKRSNLAGREITKRLIKLLFLRGYAFNSSADFETVKEIKEKLAFISHNIEMDRKISHDTVFYEQDYQLPDGTLVKVDLTDPAWQREVRGL